MAKGMSYAPSNTVAPTLHLWRPPRPYLTADANLPTDNQQPTCKVGTSAMLRAARLGTPTRRPCGSSPSSWPRSSLTNFMLYAVLQDSHGQPPACCLRTTLPRHEMKPSVVEIVSSTDCPSLITTQELLLRSVSFAALSLSAYTPAQFPLGITMLDAVCAQKYRTTRGARASVPHVAREISLMKFLTEYSTSGLSVARYPNTRLRNQDFRSSLFHSKARDTFRPRTVQVTHVDSLFGLSRTSRPREITFVFHPEYRAFSAWTHDSKPLGLEMVT